MENAKNIETRKSRKTRITWELSIAEPADAKGIQKIFNDGDFKGGISVKFNREPDPYRSLQNDGEHIVLIIVKDTQTKEILGLGGCIIRQEYVNGNLQNTAYLTGLKILKSYQGRINCIIPGYKLIEEKTAEYNPFYYTTILESNKSAIKLLEKRRNNLPPYLFIGKYTVFCFGTGGKIGNSGYNLKRGHSDAVSSFYKENLSKYNLSPKNELLYGLKNEDFYYLQSPEGEILAACAIWNQQSYKQYIISGYSGIYRFLSHIPTQLLGYPKMPKAGKPANYASVAALIIKDDDPILARLFLKMVLYEAKAYDFVMMGLFENHPLMDVALKLRHIKYQSRLYAVDYARNGDSTGCLDGWPIMLDGRPIMLDGRPIMLEVGLL